MSYTLTIGGKSFELPPASEVAPLVKTKYLRAAADTANPLGQAALAFGMAEATGVPGLMAALDELSSAESSELVGQWMEAGDDEGMESPGESSGSEG